MKPAVEGEWMKFGTGPADLCIGFLCLALISWAEGAHAAMPIITVQPRSQIVRGGTTVQFTVEATGESPLLFYQWRFNANNLAGQTNAVLSLLDVQAKHAGTYSVLVSDFQGSVLSQDAVLEICWDATPGDVESVPTI